MHISVWETLEEHSRLVVEAGGFWWNVRETGVFPTARCPIANGHPALASPRARVVVEDQPLLSLVVKVTSEMGCEKTVGTAAFIFDW